ncbi:MAG TPA: polysaccharide biosynthesis tyrosine autokinase [Pyrinomonadaceae bacterium]|nr:polysaccharide biosynthesis tyrosine autokinase [Pyrinomonadaceae bacterium]
MVSEDNRLLSLSAVERGLDRPLSDIAQPKPYGISPSDPTHLRDYLFVVLKRKWLILTLVLVITSLVTIQMYRQPSVYQATTQILIEPKKQNILQAGQGVVINTGGDKDPAYWNTQLKLLENPALARQVILTLGLHRDPTFFGSSGQTSIGSSLRRLIYGEDQAQTAPAPATKVEVVGAEEVASGQLSQQELAKLQPYEDTMAANLSVDPVVGTNLIYLSYKHTNPELAQRIVNTYADAFVYNNAERQTTGNERALKTVGEKIAELQNKINVDEQERFAYVTKHELPFSAATPGAPAAPGSNLPAERLAKLSSSLLEAESNRKNLQSLYETAAKSTDPNEIPEVSDNKRIQTLREKLDTLKQKREELLEVYTQEWPDVKKVDAQIKMLEESLTKAPREVVAAMRARYEAAVATENRLRQSYDSQRADVSGKNRAQLELSVINQRIATNTQYLNTLMQRQQELENTLPESMKSNNVSVTQYSRSGVPIGPARMRNIVIAFLLSLGVGIGLAFLLDYLDDTLKSIEDVDRYIHLPALALIPTNRAERPRLKGKGPQAAEADESTALALIDDVRSPIAEAYRHLRTSLLLSSAGQPPKTILVTSSQPSEGKTTTAVNTAVMLAQTGADVLVIDCDLRRPRMHTHFNVSNAAGLTNFLSGDSDLDALLQPYEKLPNLRLLTSGPVPPNPAELLGSDEMRKLLNLVGDRFTHIVIDSPPAISFTDASILSTMVDGVVLVVHGGRSSRAIVRRAKQQLLDVGANIFGIVLNNVRLEATNYYYYAGYYSSYYTDDEGGGAPDAAAGEGARGAGL